MFVIVTKTSQAMQATSELATANGSALLKSATFKRRNSENEQKNQSLLYSFPLLSLLLFANDFR
jgi:hypothetical protein